MLFTPVSPKSNKLFGAGKLYTTSSLLTYPKLALKPHIQPERKVVQPEKGKAREKSIKNN